MLEYNSSLILASKPQKLLSDLTVMVYSSHESGIHPVGLFHKHFPGDLTGAASDPDSLLFRLMKRRCPQPDERRVGALGPLSSLITLRYHGFRIQRPADSPNNPTLLIRVWRQNDGKLAGERP